MAQRSFPHIQSTVHIPNDHRHSYHRNDRRLNGRESRRHRRRSHHHDRNRDTEERRHRHSQRSRSRTNHHDPNRYRESRRKRKRSRANTRYPNRRYDDYDGRDVLCPNRSDRSSSNQTITTESAEHTVNELSARLDRVMDRNGDHQQNEQNELTVFLYRFT